MLLSYVLAHVAKVTHSVQSQLVEGRDVIKMPKLCGSMCNRCPALRVFGRIKMGKPPGNGN